MNELPKRKPNRLQNYDYSQNGAYFVTICAKNRECLFGKIVGDAALGIPNTPNVPNVEYSEYGKIVCWLIQNINTEIVSVDVFVIMPNHVHMLIAIHNNAETPQMECGTTRASSPTVGQIVNALKSLTTKQIGFSPWQRSFHDRIIRNEDEYSRIYEYIVNNPASWAEDCHYQLCGATRASSPTVTCVVENE